MSAADFYARADRQSPGPLAGVRVLEATNYGAGPFCGMVLADFGARSIKIEPPGSGDPVRQIPPFVGGQRGTEHSAWYLSINRNKQAITLDLRKPEGQAIFRELAAQSDIVVENYAPGVMARWGLDYASLAKDLPGLIYVSVSGFGQFGPLAHRKGFDPVAQAMSGLMSVTGEPDGRPLRAGFAFADDLSGWLGAMGAMAALHHRHRTGEGQHVDSSLVDAILYASDMGIMGAANAGYIWPRQGAGTDTAAPLSSYPCQGGRYVFVHAVFDKAWEALCEAMGRPDLKTDPRTASIAARGAHIPFVNEVVGAYTAARTVEQVVDEAERTGFIAAPILDFGEVAREEHFLAREGVAQVDHPLHGPLKLQGVSPKFSRTPARVRTPAARMGEHNQAVYGEMLGYSAQRMAALHEAGVI